MSDSATFPVPSNTPTPLNDLLGPRPDEIDRSRGWAASQLLTLRKQILEARAVVGLFVAVAGLFLVSLTVGVALWSVYDAWRERVIFSEKGQAERLKYMVAFLTFKAAALGGALTGGLLLVRAGNLLSGGGGSGDDKSSLEVKLPSSGD